MIFLIRVLLKITMKKIKIPILMYHEVQKNLSTNSSSYQMTPSYYVCESLFEEQLCTLADNGYTTLHFDDVQHIPLTSKNKYVIITFDDGWHGNYSYALPLLKKYGFKATFFITLSLVGRNPYMSWQELNELLRNGMSVQSHAVTHNPLHTMTRSEEHTS